jgi:hypothetical protein
MLKRVENYLLREDRIFEGATDRLWRLVCAYEGTQPTVQELQRANHLGWQLEQYGADFPHLHMEVIRKGAKWSLVKAEVRAVVLQA